MDVQKVVKELKEKYPGKNIILNPPDDPTEIVCEIEPASLDPEKSVAIAILDNNIKHFHRRSKETYEVIKGTLEITKGGKTHFLSPGEKLVIEPEEYHMAKGKETWVKVTSVPGWTSEDQFLISEATKFK
ncbi:cupin domain-containing protein [Patescibacteria group bacterium]